MKAFFFASLLFTAAPIGAQTFIDQVDGGSALLCSSDSGEWVCKPISIETLRELGYTDVEGTIIIDEPAEEKEEECGC